MRVAIIGATGNAGTALLHALAHEPDVQDLLGIARRPPDSSRPPYAAARWEQVDLAVPVAHPGDEDHVLDQLTAALTGMDAVVHLAWLVQPNRHRELLRRANVDGTRRVITACRRAGIEHLVVASSVGAYSAVHDDEPRDESWPTGGIPTSHYSVDKAAQERLLDDAESDGLAIARVRPALVFDADAGAEITRYFLGALVPPPLLRPATLPLLPLPAGLRLQVVHSADLADAYRRILVQGATGAFNIATAPVLHGQDLAEGLDHGRALRVPPAALRRAVSLGWQARAVAADPGWLDMGMSVPVMDTSHARTELGWQPQHDASSTLRELLQSMAAGQGTASTPMRPRGRWPQDQAPPGHPLQVGTTDRGHRIPAHLERDVLGLYLSDHLAAATAGAERCERMASAYADSDMGSALDAVATEIRQEREFLQDLLRALEIRVRPHRKAVAWLAERAGRAKLNRRPAGSPMTPLLELEILRSAVAGKLAGWQTMAELAPDLGLPAHLFTSLADRAREQAATLERLHHPVIRRAFCTGQQAP